MAHNLHSKSTKFSSNNGLEKPIAVYFKIIKEINIFV